MYSSDARHGSGYNCSIADSEFIRDQWAPLRQAKNDAGQNSAKLIDGIDINDGIRRAMLPTCYQFKREIVEGELPEFTRIGLENKGIYGWWDTKSSSPCPSALTFTTPQRRLIPGGDRISEVERHERVSHDIKVNGYNEHSEVIEMLKNENAFDRFPVKNSNPDNLSGHELCTKTVNGTMSLNFGEFQKPLMLAVSLFRLAAHGELEPFAFSKQIRRVILYSRLSWYIFGLEATGGNRGLVHHPTHKSWLEKLLRLEEETLPRAKDAQKLYSGSTDYKAKPVYDYKMKHHEWNRMEIRKIFAEGLMPYIQRTWVNLITCANPQPISTQYTAEGVIYDPHWTASPYDNAPCTHKNFNEYVDHKITVPNPYGSPQKNPDFPMFQYIKPKKHRKIGSHSDDSSGSSDAGDPAELKKEADNRHKISRGLDNKKYDQCPVTFMSNPDAYDLTTLKKNADHNRTLHMRENVYKQYSSDEAQYGSFENLPDSFNLDHHDSAKPSVWELAQKAAKLVSKTFNYLVKDERDDWVPRELKPNPKSVERLKYILKDLRAKEVELSKQNFGARTALKFSFSDFAAVVVPHMSEKVLGIHLKNAIDQSLISDESLESKSMEKPFYKDKTADHDSLAVNNMLGYRIGGYVGDQTTMGDNKSIEPLVYCNEPPNHSVHEMLDPLKFQVSRRVNSFKKHMQDAAFNATADDIDVALREELLEDTEVNWWTAPETARKQIRETQAEIYKEYYRLEELRKLHVDGVDPKNQRKPNVNYETAELEPRLSTTWANAKYTYCKQPLRRDDSLYGLAPPDPTGYLAENNKKLYDNTSALTSDRGHRLNHVPVAQVNAIDMFEEHSHRRRPAPFIQHKESPPGVRDLKDIFGSSFEE